MLKFVLENIESKKLFSKSDVLLVAVSGGVDSMVLLHFLKSNGFSVKAVHCNFKLRGVDADAESNLVKSYCEEHHLPFLIKEFNTKKFATDENISIQMAARNLRYNWFNELIIQKEGKYILTAHHLQDQTETFFINLLRGSGLNGLKGIPEVNNNVVRPFLYVDKKQILDYAITNEVPYLNDKSNMERKYLRNKIRLDVLPVLRSINNSFDVTLQTEMKLFNEANTFINSQFEEIKKACCRIENNLLFIEKSFFFKCNYPTLLLHSILAPYGFNPSQINDILKTENSISGKLFNSYSHTLANDRKNWVVGKLSQADSIDKIVDLNGSNKILDKLFLFEFVEGPVYINDANRVALDAELIKLPLRITQWVQGDRFFPAGTDGSKKLSDYFVSQKMNIFQKRNQLLVKSGNDIAWVVQKRQDRRFVVTPQTRRSLLISVIDEG